MKQLVMKLVATYGEIAFRGRTGDNFFVLSSSNAAFLANSRYLNPVSIVVM